MAQLQTSSSQAPKHLGTGTIPHVGAGFWLVAQLWLSTGGSRMKVETELVLSACCNTVVIHEVLCCWETLQGAWGRPDWDAQTLVVLPHAGALPGAGSAACPALLQSSLPSSPAL